jgi:oxygen-independent coproporphyrinogen-3 oxidase
MSPDLVAPPLSLYVHLPWCVRKCPYCDFNSHVHKGELPEDAYVAALLRDLERDVAAHLVGDPRIVETVFLGGGTPSLFRPESLARLFAGIRERVPLASDAEITMEANPGTVEHGRFDGYREAGVNRVSLGAQSFGAAQLAALGRIHAASDTERAVGELRGAGLAEFNLDLMYALPAQDLAGALSDLERALQLGPTHLSHYQLTLEPGTVYYHRPPALPDEDAAAEMQSATADRLAAAGFRQYEVSAWARPGHECRHNLNYWRYGDYLGVGAGAHGKVTDARAGRIVRTAKQKQPREYMELVAGERAAGTVQDIPVAERPFEYMLNALRLVEGFTLGGFARHTGVAPAVILPVVERLAARGLLVADAERWRPTPLGLRFLNDLQAAFLPDELAAGTAAAAGRSIGA